ncbi:hypothetical protein LCGC14_2119620, partial [marine sediment metagenome]
MIFIGEHGTHLNPSTIPGTHNSGYAPVTPVTVLRPESMARSMGSLRLPQRALVMPTVQGSQHTINPMHVRMLDNEARARALPSPRVAPPVRWLSGGLADLSQTTMILAPESAKTPIGPPAQPQQLPGREPPPEPPPEQPPEQPPEPAAGPVAPAVPAKEHLDFEQIIATAKTSGSGAWTMTAAEFVGGFIIDATTTGGSTPTMPTVAAVIALLPGYIAGITIRLVFLNLKPIYSFTT